MNWVDIVVLLLLFVSTAYGVKRGLIREIMSAVGLVVGIILAIHHHDAVTNAFLSHMKASPLLLSLISFLLILGLSYVGFRLLGFALARAASVNQLGNIDKVGGGIVGVIKGWIIIGFILLMLFYLPLPASLINAIDTSFIAPAMLGTMPLLYEGTSMFHPSNKSFLGKLKSALARHPYQSASAVRGGMLMPAGDWQSERTQKALENLERHFGIKR